MGMSISDEELNRLGEFFVSRNISARYGISFETFVEMMEDSRYRYALGYDQPIRKEIG